jgi:CheY-like chemotaxis protein
MPNMNGFEICRRERKGPNKDLKIVLFTASADVDVINNGKAAGADEILSKPFSIEKIKETIKNALENKDSPELSLGEELSQVYAP